MVKINRAVLVSALFSVISIGLIGCGGSQTTTTTENKGGNTTASNTTTSKPADSKPAENKSETASADKIGVAECDEFIEKYEACLFSKVPEAQRTAFKPGLDQWKKSWKDMAANPTTKAGLSTACKTALDGAKTSMASFSCKWD